MINETQRRPHKRVIGVVLAVLAIVFTGMMWSGFSITDILRLFGF
jgi:hypothetical protein